MPALFVFLIKVNAALLLFCAGYYLVLRHLTFYTLNRIYLVCAILFATIYPRINLSRFAESHEQIAKPVRTIILNWQAPAEDLVKPLSQPNYWYWVEVAFWTGAALLCLRLLTQLFSLYRLYHKSTPAQLHGHDVRLIDGESGPFSFWKSIYINPDRHETNDLKAILQHEQVHVNEWHTLDVLLAELSTVFYWFNPGVWLMKKAIRENIEFITDRKIIRNGADSKQYQYSLVSVSFASSSNTIVNHFNISTIKKRIIMMNAQRSSRVNITRYVFLVPAVVALLLVFTISKAALIKKSGAYKAVTAAVNTMTNRVHAISTPKPVIMTARAKNTPAMQAPPVKRADTIRKGGIFISMGKSADSLTYVINGKKATKADFKALDSDNIYAIELVSGEKAVKILDGVDQKHDVLFVTTDGSAEGKKFKEKIDKLNGDFFMADAKSMSASGFGSGVTIAGGDSNDEGATTVTGVYTDGHYTKIHPKMMRLHSFPKIAYSVHADSFFKSEPFVVSDGDSVSVYTIHGDKKTKTRVYSYKTPKYNSQGWTSVYGNSPKVAYSFRPGKLSKTWDFDTETNINHLSSKMIIIDGKEASASDLKKVSAADIESMSVKSGEEQTKKYGDKAKNGVLYIVTKK